jgi:hypothetical protein
VAAVPNGPVAAPEGEPKFPVLRVNSVVLNGERSSAMVNDQIVHVGDSVTGVQVVEIAEYGFLGQIRGFRHNYGVGDRGGK